MQKLLCQNNSNSEMQESRTKTNNSFLNFSQSISQIMHNKQINIKKKETDLNLNNLRKLEYNDTKGS